MCRCADNETSAKKRVETCIKNFYIFIGGTWGTQVPLVTPMGESAWRPTATPAARAVGFGHARASKRPKSAVTFG